MRSTPELDRKLRERLIEALNKSCEGNADAFARKLGHLNGGYVRQIVKGEKPVRESIIERVHAMEEAQVGDKVLKPGGGQGEIKSLSGESMRCKDPDKPIRARIE